MQKPVPTFHVLTRPLFVSCPSLLLRYSMLSPPAQNLNIQIQAGVHPSAWRSAGDLAWHPRFTSALIVVRLSGGVR